MYSPELETLDQLLTGDMPLSLIAKLYPSIDHCRRGVLGLLQEGDVVLIDSDENEVPQWSWKHLVSPATMQEDVQGLRLRLTTAGAKRIS